MKKLIILSLAIVSMSFVPGIKKDKLVGTWEHKATSEEDETFRIYFQADGIVVLESDSEKLGGDECYIPNLDILAKLSFVTDYSKKPHHVDFIMTDLSTNQEFQRIANIFEFLENGDLKIALGDEDSRPTTYDVENSYVMKRIK